MSDPVADVVRRHLGLDGEAACRVADSICKLGIGDDPFLYDAHRDAANLERIARAVHELSAALDVDAMTQAAQDTLSRALVIGRNSSAAAALHEIAEHADSIRRGVWAAHDEIRRDNTLRKGVSRMNLRGVQMVAVARDEWERFTGEPAPARALNLSAPFGKFLSDLFDAAEIEGDPRAAFRAWAALPAPA